jgi:hypothetical protein
VSVSVSNGNISVKGAATEGGKVNFSASRNGAGLFNYGPQELREREECKWLGSLFTSHVV